MHEIQYFSHEHQCFCTHTLYTTSKSKAVMGIHKSPIQNTPELNIIAAWKKKAQHMIMLRRELEKKNNTKNNVETSMTWLRQ